MPVSKSPAEPAPAFCIQSKTEHATFTVNSREGLILQCWGRSLWHIPGGGHVELPALPWLDPRCTGASLVQGAFSPCRGPARPARNGSGEMKGICVHQRGISHSIPPQEALGFVLGRADGGRLAQVHQTRLPSPLLSLSTVHPACSAMQG